MSCLDGVHWRMPTFVMGRIMTMRISLLRDAAGLTTAAVASLGLILVAGFFLFTAPVTRDSNAAPMAASPTTAAALPATTPIVPSPVIDPSAPLFSGTGDQSNGGWTGR